MAKKLIVLVLAACLVFGAVSMAASAETMGLGVYSVLDAASSAYVEDGDAYDGAYTVETTTCAVVLGEGNVIESIRFDMTQNKLGFGAAGEALTEAGTLFASKVELKENYGMVAYAKAPAGEWYTQAAAFEAFCVGKTVEEVLAFELGEDGKLVDADMKTSCSIIVTSFMRALELAVANAR